MKKFVIIVAGGSGERMGSEMPKQFLRIQNKPIIIHTIDKFRETLPEADLILVLPSKEVTAWEKIAEEFNVKGISIAEGGSNRFQSVKAGLAYVEKDSLVAVHDGVRPFVNSTTILNAFSGAKANRACIPVIKISESIREVTGEETRGRDRENFRIVQTPQCFHSELLKQAYQQEYRDNFTDDASVVEAFGVKVSLVDGNQENIKITHPFDLKVAESLMPKA